LPFSINDGSLGAGRGWSESLRAGLRVERGRLSLTLAPELVASENIPYELAAPEVTVARPPSRNPLSSPWHVQPYSIDLPQRFGYLPIWRLDPGQSTFAVEAGRERALSGIEHVRGGGRTRYARGGDRERVVGAGRPQCDRAQQQRIVDARPPPLVLGRHP